MKKLFLIVWVIGGCSPKIDTHVQQAMLLKIESDGKVEASADSLIEPYRLALRGVMDEAIIFNPHQLQKKQPESALGNLLADMVLEAARTEFGWVDLAMLNYGGIRAGLPADTLRIGHVLEMLPFNNMLQLVEMDSTLLHTFLQHWVEKGGTPFAGVSLIAKGKVLQNISIGGTPLSNQKKYRVVMPDYVANGGDGCGFLSAATTQQVGTRLLSEIIIVSLKQKARNELQLKAGTDGRFVIE
ncbi:MAG: hypothetical protein C0424_10020 [Sphingobacteriaceae bacterium]|nr:hypothetical protein [Sphingobacteriaceae bacterium]